ncbi:ComEC/Rec2 family competence protein [Candidatus Comchoanobacter bicostacola]|uniref:ComEC/Rec2 family competence protein n=1 Tax=Candidatus Comchoanobacter bicostacola TaxID=2919598 RepID=A0ABY5DK60_9GAMM|nr:ComEC/Rec2 family competence protein [Candidatus Comchoanobacter bicostacola]UTC24868.1 ComEC/Rec2 family competence protein [Candidatus Comchoanobacter bicostacola]
MLVALFIYLLTVTLGVISLYLIVILIPFFFLSNARMGVLCGLVTLILTFWPKTLLDGNEDFYIQERYGDRVLAKTRSNVMVSGVLPGREKYCWVNLDFHIKNQKKGRYHWLYGIDYDVDFEHKECVACSLSIADRYQRWVSGYITKLDYDHADLITTLLFSESSGTLWYFWGVSYLLSLHQVHVKYIFWVTRKNTYWALQSLVIVIGGLYYVLSGYSGSIRRVLFIYILPLIFSCLGRSINSISTFLLATAVEVALDPFWVRRLGFWLTSAMALLSMQTFKHKGFRGIVVRSTVATTILSLFNYKTHILSLVMSFLLWPIFRHIIYPMLTLGLMLLAFLPKVSLFLWGKALSVLLIIEQFMDYCAQYPIQVLVPISKIHTVIYALWVMIDWRVFALQLLWLIPQTTDISPGEVEVQVLNAGHGLCVFLRTKHYTMLYDAGSMRKDFISKTLQPFLHKEKVSKFDAIVYSHADLDHYSASDFLKLHYPVETVWVSEPLYLRKQQLCREGGAWEWDGVRFSFLHPDNQSLYKGNKASCVLYVESNHQSALFPGDIDKKIEHEILKRYPSLETSLLVAGHHGSATSSSIEWVEQLKPLYVVVSGYKSQVKAPALLGLNKLKYPPFKLFLR